MSSSLCEECIIKFIGYELSVTRGFIIQTFFKLDVDERNDINNTKLITGLAKKFNGVKETEYLNLKGKRRDIDFYFDTIDNANHFRNTIQIEFYNQFWIYADFNFLGNLQPKKTIEDLERTKIALIQISC